MYELKTYARDKNGNRGKLLYTSKYPTKEGRDRALAATRRLCKNQWKFPTEWNLKNAVIIAV